MALSPFQSLLLSSEVRANFSRSFFTPWHGSYWCQPIPTPTLQSGVGVSPPQANRYTSPHLSSSFSDSRSVREPKFSRVTVFSQPTVCIHSPYAKPISKSLPFTFQTLVPIYFKFCHKVFMKSGLRKTFLFARGKQSAKKATSVFFWSSHTSHFYWSFWSFPQWYHKRYN